MKEHFAEFQSFITFSVVRLELRFDGFERKSDAHHEAMSLILGDILARLPARRG